MEIDLPELDAADEDWQEGLDAPVEPGAPLQPPEQRALTVSPDSHGQRLDVFLVSGAPEFRWRLHWPN